MMIERCRLARPLAAALRFWQGDNWKAGDDWRRRRGDADVPDYAIVIGVPAKLLRRSVSLTSEKRLNVIEFQDKD